MDNNNNDDDNDEYGDDKQQKKRWNLQCSSIWRPSPFGESPGGTPVVQIYIKIAIKRKVFQCFRPPNHQNSNKTRGFSICSAS